MMTNSKQYAVNWFIADDAGRTDFIALTFSTLNHLRVLNESAFKIKI